MKKLIYSSGHDHDAQCSTQFGLTIDYLQITTRMREEGHGGKISKVFSAVEAPTRKKQLLCNWRSGVQRQYLATMMTTTMMLITLMAMALAVSAFKPKAGSRTQNARSALGMASSFGVQKLGKLASGIAVLHWWEALCNFLSRFYLAELTYHDFHLNYFDWT